MADFPEGVWKARFVEVLGERFGARGTSRADATADAQVHADDCYPRLRAISPEDAARAEFEALFPRLVRTH